MRRPLFVFVAAIILVVSFAPVAFGQQMDMDKTFDGQLFRPSIFGGNYFGIEGAHTLYDLCWGVGLYVNYVNSPIEVRVDDEFNRGVLDSVTSANAVAMFSPWWFFAIGADIPIHINSRGYDFSDPEADIADQSSGSRTSETVLGDVKAEMRIAFTQMEKQYVGVALAPYAHFPTGDPNKMLGEGTINYGGKVLLETDAKIFNIALNGGFLYREPRTVFGVDLGNAFTYGAGVSRKFGGLGFSVEYFGSYFTSSSSSKFQADPMEIMGTVSYQFGNRLRVMGGGGTGMSTGVGAPAYRILGGIDYYPECLPPQTGTLIIEVIDVKGIPVPSALVIKKTKTATTKTDEFGKYTAEAAPGSYKISAAAKGYMPASATGVVIAGKTTILKIVLSLIPKDTVLNVEVVHKKTGKPIPGSGIIIKDVGTGKIQGFKAPEGLYSSKFQPGTYSISGIASGYEKIDVEVTVNVEKVTTVKIPLRKKIIKIGKIQFGFDSADLLPASFPVLDDVVQKIKNSDIIFKTVIIEGHTSSEGSDEYNQKLSQRRGESVMKYLIKKGLPADKLEVQAFGESRPIADNETDAGMEINRRVEFIFEE